ncbi:hypothetical protein ACSS6W_009430 [Trichoderma asperelloides]|uniref:Uncharacterized protein n=1 Tax=Trichoderma asperellum (strain ATCC 204424 / CBS 433.97 / NBRC 101777) TaxID=1042311 RepID=A0A2T3ZAZ6_TRIA4|nr:hypothetical protein M441DRAFT_56780 [Trichoderma asperellum CBS 433.97]PTB41984.1 hypothetical protein M441DRAFT_56780 [Trichoderma asperellum CBS 433.97]
MVAFRANTPWLQLELCFARLGVCLALACCGMLGILLVLSYFAVLEETNKPRREVVCFLGVPERRNGG